MMVIELTNIRTMTCILRVQFESTFNIKFLGGNSGTPSVIRRMHPGCISIPLVAITLAVPDMLCYFSTALDLANKGLPSMRDRLSWSLSQTSFASAQNPFSGFVISDKRTSKSRWFMVCPTRLSSISNTKFRRDEIYEGSLSP